MDYVLLALVAQFIVPGLTLLVAVAAAYFTARWLGIPEFRPFRRAPEARTKRFVVRTVSVIAAFTACLVTGALSARASGTAHGTMFVDIHDGPARSAGMRDGDRIVSVDGKRHDDFEALRADIQSSNGPRTITFERDGERMTREVDPMPQRRIGVEQRMETRPATFGEAMERAFSICFSPFRILLRSFQTTEFELAGPVAVVQSLEPNAVPRLVLFLFAGAMYAAYVWPVLLLLNLVDAGLLHVRRNDR